MIRALHLAILLALGAIYLQAEDEKKPVVFLGKVLPERLHHIDAYSVRDIYIEDVPGSKSYWLGPWVEKVQVNGIARFYIVKGYNRFYVNAAFPDEPRSLFFERSVGRLDFYGPFEGKPSDHFKIPVEQGAEAPLPKVKHMIDTHIHLYDTGREGGVPWPPKDDTVLYIPHFPEEFKKVSKPTGLTGVVIVEASHYLEDNRWMLDLVGDDDFFVALVGNIDPYREDFEEQLVKLKKDPRFVGVRARNGRDAPPIDYADAQVRKSFRALAKHGLSVDLLLKGTVEDVESVDRIARAIPDLRIVVNHVFGYRIDGKAPDPAWVAAIEKVAENKNVWCKVSGLYQRCDTIPAPGDLAHYRGVIDVLWKNLGEKRLIFGTNWPCTKRSGDYAGFVRLVNAYFSAKGPEASERYFWKNAAEAYRLDLE